MVKLYNGDSLDMLKTIPDNSVDLILTDPPYGIDYQSRKENDKSLRKPKIVGDREAQISFIRDIVRVLKPSGAIFVFTRWDVQQNVIDELAKQKTPAKNVLIWDKVVHGMGNLHKAYGSRYESIVFAPGEDFRFQEKRPQDIICCQRVDPEKLRHPNQKPVELLQKLIRQTTQNGDMVLDCFMGSGSTGVACVREQRNFIGIEIDQNHFKVAKERIESKEAQLTLW